MEALIREGKLRSHSSEASCDVVLSCPGERLMAHKLVLSIASPLLRDLLVQDLAEPSLLIFADFTSATMSLILDYIYTGSVQLHANAIDDFVAAAKVLQIHIDSGCFSHAPRRKSVKKLPNLVPLEGHRQRRELHKFVSCVLPSPWRPRGAPALGDPRTYCSEPPLDGNKSRVFESGKSAAENDHNNNFGHVKSPVASSVTSLLASRMDEMAHRSVDKQCAKVGSDARLEKRSVTPPPKSIKLEGSHDDDAAEKMLAEDNSKQKPFKCDDCGKCFSQLRNYKYHRSVHEGTKEFAAACPECGKIFNDKGYLSSHMKIHRDRKEYECPHCPKRFNQRVAYNMHLRIHTGVKPHECPTCGKSFSRKMLLKQHHRVHTGERPYSCPECGKTFADRSNMSLHARLHTGVKPYACNLCPKSFTKKHHLKTHMNFHTGLKPYNCENCGLAFSQSSNMRTHYKKCILKESPASSNVEKIDFDSNSSDAK